MLLTNDSKIDLEVSCGRVLEIDATPVNALVVELNRF